MRKYNKILKKKYKKTTAKVYSILKVSPTIRQVHEDGVSTIILKNLEKLRKKGFHVDVKSLEIREGETGKDFDLWIGENDTHYLRFCVQAKSFGNNTKTSQSYNIDEEQCDKILAHASSQEKKSYPLYFLYQHIEDDNLAKNHFSFLEDFKPKYSSVTFTSAYNIKKAMSRSELKFKDIHRNNLEGSKWKNKLWDLFQSNDDQIALPLYQLYDVSPTAVKKWKRLIKDKVAFFFFFLPNWAEEDPLPVHTISKKQIFSKYGYDSYNEENRNYNQKNFLSTKHIIVIDDNKQLIDQRKSLINDIINE